MDPTQIKKIQAMNRYKRRQFLDNLYFYSLTALICSLFCCITLFLPYLSSLLRVFFFECIPSFVSVLFSSKFLFIIGNLIILVLRVNSIFFSSKSSSTTDVYYDEYIKSRVSRQTQRPQIPTPQVIKAKKLYEYAAENEDLTREDGQRVKGGGWVEGAVEVAPGREEDNLDEEGELSSLSASDELNKRADDFIARVNKQRKLELGLLQCDSN